jgi:hypothetical protein
MRQIVGRDQATLAAKREPARQALDDARQSVAWMEGQAMTADSTVVYALEAERFSLYSPVKTAPVSTEWPASRLLP